MIVVDSLSFTCSLQESSHGNSYGKDEKLTPIDQQHQFFGSLNFPVTTDSEAWKEKVSFKLWLLVCHIMSVLYTISVQFT